MGVITIKTSERNGRVAGCRLVSNEDQIIIITDGGKIIRTRVSEIPVLGRNTQGVKVINLESGEKVVGVARFGERDEEDLDEASEGADELDGEERSEDSAGAPVDADASDDAPSESDAPPSESP